MSGRVQAIPVVRDEEVSSWPRDPISSLISLFDSCAEIYSGVTLHESMVPGAEYALRLWASARGLSLEETSDYPDLPRLRVVSCSLDGQICSSHTIVVCTKVLDS